MLMLRNWKFLFSGATKTFDFVAFFVTGRLEIKKGGERNGSGNGEMVQ